MFLRISHKPAICPRSVFSLYASTYSIHTSMDTSPPRDSDENSNPLSASVRVNLLKKFNKCEKYHIPQSAFVPDEISKLQKDRLKAQYHLKPHPFFDKNVASSSESFMCEIDVNKPSLRKQLKDYVARKNSSRKVLRGLDNIAKRFSNILPPYDFTKYNVMSANPFELMRMTSGDYIHLGIRNNLQLPHRDMVRLISINIALYVVEANSNGTSRPSYLVILGHQIDFPRAFLIGVYYGKFPIEIIANELLQPLVAEILYLQTHGTLVGNRCFGFIVNCFICDPIANSLVTCTTFPNSLYGCSKCKCEGTLDPFKMVTSFPIISSGSSLRDDDDFKFCVVTEHHLATPVLSELGFGLISQVSIDYKHVICLGVMRTLIELWLSGDVEFKLNRQTIATINSELVQLAPSCPTEFKAKPKPIDTYTKWTAYDFRQFLVYYGPIVLCGNLTQRCFVNFLHLNLAMRIALDPKSSDDINYYIIGQLMQNFVKEFARIYGEDRVDYNVHNLLHVEMTCRKYQCLEYVGGFRLQDTLSEVETAMNNVIVNPDFPLQSVAKILRDNNLRTAQINNFIINSKGSVISTKEPNNYFVVVNGIVCIKFIGFDQSGKLAIYGQRYLHNLPFTEIPTTSQNVLEVFTLSSMERIRSEDIISKAVVFKIGSSTYGIPLLTF